MTKQTDIADRDWMAYLDGELSEAEIEALEASLEHDEDAAAKLAGLELVGELLRERIDADDRADGIADAVMARLADDAPPAEELPIQEVPSAPANDNARTVWSLAAAAAAVAAGLFLWGQTGDDAAPHALAPSQPTSAATLEPLAPAPETLGQVAAAPQRGDEDEDAVEIAQLDFGEGSGSVFKVANANKGVHTAVVWVTDLGDEE